MSALAASAAKIRVRASTADVELSARDDGTFVYVVAVRRKGTTSVVTFSGLPKRIRAVEVLGEWVQRPLPPPIGAGSQVFRTVDVEGGVLRDWLAPHDARVYRFRK